MGKTKKENKKEVHNTENAISVSVRLFKTPYDFDDSTDDIIPGCSLSNKDFSDIASRPPQNKILSEAMLKNAGGLSFVLTGLVRSDKAELFTNVGMTMYIYDIMLSASLYNKCYKTKDLGCETLLKNNGIKKLRYLPYLLWINVYKNYEYKYTIEVPTLRESCIVCGKKQLDFKSVSDYFQKDFQKNENAFFQDKQNENALFQDKQLCAEKREEANKALRRKMWLVLAFSKVPDTCKLCACSRCNKFIYCGPKCQKIDWNTHKMSCVFIKTENENQKHDSRICEKDRDSDANIQKDNIQKDNNSEAYEPDEFVAQAVKQMITNDFDIGKMTKSQKKRAKKKKAQKRAATAKELPPTNTPRIPT